MKVAIINDTHFGARGDSITFTNHFNRFYSNVFFPTLEKHEIKTVYHLGDLVDRRKFININTLNNMKVNFLDRLIGKDVHIIAGNHDVYHKNSNVLNVLNEVVCPYGFNVYLQPTEVKDILFLPWINSENFKQSIDTLKTTRCNTVFGHLEIKGFEMHRGTVSDDGLDMDLFSRFDLVASGHFHQKSTRGNIHYLGAPYEITWADHGEIRGFHIFDTKKRKLEFINNPYVIFHKIEYDDERDNIDVLRNQDFSHLYGSYVKIIVKKKNNPYWFDLFFDAVETSGPVDIRVIDGMEQNISEGQEGEGSVIMDTNEILKEYTSKLNLEDSQRKKLDELLRKLYDEALTVRDNF